jgi:hypothetical protein
MKKTNKKKLREVTVTGISAWKQSGMGGRYRYIFVEGLDPSCLYENMENYPEWNDFIKKIKPGRKIYCHAEVITTNKGKTLMTCDTVPTVLGDNAPRSYNKFDDDPREISGLQRPIYQGRSDIDTILEIDRKLERSGLNVKTRVVQNNIYEIYGPGEWTQIQKVNQ